MWRFSGPPRRGLCDACSLAHGEVGRHRQLHPGLIYTPYPAFDRVAAGVIEDHQRRMPARAHALRLPCTVWATAAGARRAKVVLIVRRIRPRPAVRRSRGGPARLLAGEPLHGLQYEDLIAAADVVVSKPGYGIVSECVANDTALLYTSRGRFIEYDLFVAEMPRILRCRHISQEDLFAGRWADAVDALAAQPPPPERPRTDGAELAAARILNWLEGSFGC